MLTPFGRAYKSPGGFHVDQVHLAPIQEDIGAHSKLQRCFLSAAQPPPIRFYMGVAGILNLNYLAALKPEKAILYDINPLQTGFWEIVFDGLANSPRAVHFSRFMSRDLGPQVTDMATRFAVLLPRRKSESSALIAQTPIRGVPKIHSWIMEAQIDSVFMGHYEHLHEMARSGNIGSITLDISDTQACRQLHELFMQEHRAGEFPGADAMYVSNVFEFLSRPGKDLFDWAGRPVDIEQYQNGRANVRAFCNPAGALIVDHEGLAGSRRHFRDVKMPDHWALAL